MNNTIKNINNLPILNKENEIVNSVNNNQVTIITAETGSGKSTQVPQMLYNAGYEVICTEPRRIAAISLAERVKEEVNESLYNIGLFNTSGIVGYKTAFESTQTEETKILFCTDGLQMAKIKLNSNKDLSKTVLIIDEVHEWNLNIETLIAWIKYAYENISTFNLKVVIMSATVDTNAITALFKNIKCNIISCEGKMFPVERIESNNSEKLETLNLLKMNKNILVFEPGKKEISNFIKEFNNLALESDNLEEGRDYVIFPLHGELQYSEQLKCFESYNVPKIIVATNVAQTSITIPDIDAVVDTGVEKIIKMENGIEGLVENRISRADCLQRAGRAGRTKEGIYVLCALTKLEERDMFSTPEIQRLSLDRVVLKLASLDLDIEDLTFVHQPDIELIKESKKKLFYLGALDKNYKITEEGKRIINIPLSVIFAKMLIEAEKVGLNDQILTAAAIFEIGSLVNFNCKIPFEIFGDVTERNVKYRDLISREIYDYKSDILVEVHIYNNIINREYPDLNKAGINFKHFIEIKKLREKLVKCLNINWGRSFDNKEFRKVLCKSMMYYMYKHNYDKNYTVVNDHDSNINYNLDKNSSLEYSDFIVGLPRTIQFKDSYGFNRKMNVISLCTEIDDIVEECVPDYMIQKGVDSDSVIYSLDEDKFYYNERISFAGKVIRIENKTLSKKIDEEKFNYWKNEVYSNIVKEENDRYIVVNHKTIEVHENYKGQKYVCLTLEDLESIEDTCIKVNGKPIEIHCGSISNTSVGFIKKALDSQFEDIAIDNFRFNFNRQHNGKSFNDIEKLIDYINTSDIKIGENEANYIDRVFPIYVGLKLKSSTSKNASLEVFEDEEVFKETLKNSSTVLFDNFVEKNYNDKTFMIVSHEGKKIETNKTNEQKKEFHNICNEIMNSIDSEWIFDESRRNSDFEMVHMFYEECINNINSFYGIN